jgi:acyl-coenzyme A synthetase/AMP-(fatty) acid ligase
MTTAGEALNPEVFKQFKEATGLDLSAYTNEEIVNQFKDKAKTTLDKIEIYRNSMKTV